MGKFLFISLLLTVLTCEQEMMSTALKRNDEQKTIRLALHDEFELELAGNPTTGYRWSWAEADSSILELRKREYHPDSDRIGSGGVERFFFKTVGAGETDLKLIYHRSWEKAVAPIDSFVVHLVVQKGG